MILSKKGKRVKVSTSGPICWSRHRQSKTGSKKAREGRERPKVTSGGPDESLRGGCKRSREENCETVVEVAKASQAKCEAVVECCSCSWSLFSVFAMLHLQQPHLDSMLLFAWAAS